MNRSCVFVLVAFALLLSVGCSDDDGVAPDGSAPAVITNLAAIPILDRAISLTWTAPGDDGTNGTATSYDLRFSTDSLGLVTPDGWQRATRVPSAPPPSAAGATQRYVIDAQAGVQLTANTTYHMAMKVSDDAGNVSELSNVATAATSRVTEWGTSGSGDGQFESIWSIATGPNGDVYVLDSGRVQKFDNRGNFILKWTVNANLIGSSVAVDHNGNVFVTDGYRVQKFTSEGEFVLEWNPLDVPNGPFLPGPIAIDSNGDVYVLAIWYDRYTTKYIQKYDNNGNERGTWVEWNLSPGGDGAPRPGAITIDRNDHVYIGENVFPGYAFYMHMYDTSGTLVERWGVPSANSLGNPGVNSCAVDPFGNVYVVEGYPWPTGERTVVFRPDRSLLSYADFRGHLAIDQAGNVFAADGSRIARIGR